MLFQAKQPTRLDEKKMSDFLPPDVLIDILARLPIKNVVQCISVCKWWYSLVTNPSFIYKHLNRSTISATNNNNNLILVRTNSNYTLRCDNKSLSEYARLGFPFKSFPNNYFRMIGCCNGLVCLSHYLSKYMDDLYLCNPLIRKMIALPPVRVTFQSHGAYMHSIGFGFDPLTHDFKVVRIVYPQQDGSTSTSTVVKAPPEVDIFTLSTGTWRSISHLVLLPYVIEEARAPQVYVNGAAYWIATDMRDQKSLILSFDMGYEVFDKIMMPASMGGTEEGLLGVRVAKFQESLSLIEHRSTGVVENCCVWMMKESWTQKFNIVMREAFRCIGFRKKGAILMATSEGYMMSYYRDTDEVEIARFKEVVNIGIADFDDDSWYKNYFADAYTESLVLLGVKLGDTVTCEL